MDILALLKKDEGSRVERKREINIEGEKAKEEFVKDLTAMANTSPGDGYIIYGITDSGRVVGIRKRKGVEESLQQIAATRCHPPVTFLCKWIDVKGKNLLLIHVPESQLRPHATSKKDVYVRRQSIIDKATPIEIQKMSLPISQSSGDRVVEEVAEDHENQVLQPSQYDLNFFPISGTPQAYRTCAKYTCFDSPGICPVFMPHFGIFAPEPEFGNTRSVICFEWEGRDHFQVSRELFRVFLKSIEERTLGLVGKAGVWNCFPMSWSFSRDKEMDYGLGADNACLAFDAHPKGGILSGIIQFERVSVYKPTNFLTFIAEIYLRGGEIFIRELALKLMLSSIPLSRDWVNNLFDVVEILGKKQYFTKPGDDVLNEPLYSLYWVPTQRYGSFKPKIRGLFGRESGSIPEFDLGLGVVIDTKQLKKAEFEIDQEDSSRWESYGTVLNEPAIFGFNEIPVQITNPIPSRKDLGSNEFNISIPTVKESIIGLAGFLVVAVNIHSFPRSS